MLDEKHPLYDSRIHDPYTMTVVTNRLSALRARAHGDSTWAVQHPLRESGSQWPWYVDSTVLGEVYNKTTEVENVADWEAVVAGPEWPTDATTSFVKWTALRHYAAAGHINASVKDEGAAVDAGSTENHALDSSNSSSSSSSAEVSMPLASSSSVPMVDVASVLALPLAEVDQHPLFAEMANSPLGVRGWSSKHGGGAPHPQGFLSVVCFQVLWDAACVKAMPSVEELAPSFPAARFVLVRADRTGVDSISRQLSVTAFPTVLLMRGSTEVARLEGPQRVAGRLVDLLRKEVTAEDVAVSEQLRSFELDQAGGGAEEEEEEEELQWTWDPEFASEDIQVLNYGTVVALFPDDSDEDSEPGVWQFKGSRDWEDMDAAFQVALERDYRSGRLYVEQSITAVGPTEGVQVTLQSRNHKVSFDMVTGMSCSFSSNPYDDLECRRKGPRFIVTGDDKYCNDQQKAADKFEQNWKEAAKKRRLEAEALNVGKDLQGVRGTNAFMEESGVHKWTVKFNHEPARLGGGDAVGIANDVAEYFGPLAYPVLGHRGGHSLGLYANGDLVFDHQVIAALTGPPRKDPLNESDGSGANDESSALDGDDFPVEAEEIQPRCCNDHPWMQSEVEFYYCQKCYTSGDGGKLPYFCAFCRDGLCQDCFDRDFKKLNKKKDKKGDAKKKKKKSSDSDQEEEEESASDEGSENEDGDDEDKEGDKQETEPTEEKYRAKAKELGLSDEEIEERIKKAKGDVKATAKSVSAPTAATPTAAATTTAPLPVIEDASAKAEEAAAGVETTPSVAEGTSEPGSASEGNPQPGIAASEVDSAPATSPESAQEEDTTASVVDWAALLAALPKGKKELDLASFIPPEPQVEPAKLFGRGSKVTLILDTDKEGGTLAFEVDGVRLVATDGTTKLTQVFAMLQATQLYPCFNTCPLDVQPPFLAAEAPDAELERAKASSSSSSSEKGKPESEEAMAKREKAKIDRAEISDLARKCRQPYSDVAKLTPTQRSSLAALIDKVLRRRVPNVQLILGEDEAIAVEKARAEAEAHDKEAKDEAAAAAADKEEATAEDSSGAGGGRNGDDDEASAAKAKKTAAGSSASPEEPMESVWWMYAAPEGWVCHTREASTIIEEALRGGRTETSVTLGTDLYTVQVTKGSDGKGPCQTSQDEGAIMKLRRHVVGPGLQGQWEMLSLKFAPPMSMSGQAALSVLEKLWATSDDLAGRTQGFGFLFLYNLLQGSTRVSCISSGGGFGGFGGFKGFGGGRRDFGKNDGHRFAMLATQLFSDKHKRSLLASCVHVLANNRHVCVRMPKLRDNRKSRQSPLFNGWCDEAEPQSPLSDLFAKLVPTIQRLKRQRGALRYPPKPPHPEMPTLPQEVPATTTDTSSFSSSSTVSSSSSSSDSSGRLHAVRAQLSDTACSERTVRPLNGDEIFALATEVRFSLGGTRIATPAPILVEDEAAFEMIARACAEADQLLVVAFCAEWCGACQQLTPVFRTLNRRLPVATFAKVDCDECESVSHRFRIKALPTVLFLRGGATSAHVVGRIEGGGAGFSGEFLKVLQPLCSTHDLTVLRAANQPELPSRPVAGDLAVDAIALQALAQAPLGALSEFVTASTRAERGLKPVSGEMSALDEVGGHEASTTAVASQMLSRMQQDVAAFATAANTDRATKVKSLSDLELAAFFANAPGTDAALASAASTLKTLVAELAAIRDNDAKAINAIIPLLKQAANFVDTDRHEKGSDERRHRVAFQLKRCARQAPEVWMEFLFGSLLSSQGTQDLQKLNPYLSQRAMDTIEQLLVMVMLRANRVGQANRCLAIAATLTKLLAAAQATEPGDARTAAGATLLPKLAQASGDLGDSLSAKRHFMVPCSDAASTTESSSGGSFSFDPRFLLFEFVWNLLLRRTQVKTVQNFVRTLTEGGSKVKQMIMGAGKTTVVAPLLALMLADGKSLVLSVVPKALLEMSRKQMRETFSTIMSKRIYTLSFDRGTVITPATHRSLNNAKRNRGVVVATPTTLKSIQLVYVETLKRLDETRRAGPKDRVAPLAAQVRELKAVLQTFREAVLLLDEVDMVLHPLKSELNFPIGDKFALDGGEVAGERWSLPTHLVDALFYTQTGRVSTFESSGLALALLERLKRAVNEGYAQKALQKLPHVTLLDPAFYHAKLKPLLAEWAYLWLQKQHLHGIDKEEAIQYVLEGAVARSDLSVKVSLLDAAIARCDVDLGARPEEPPLTEGHKRALQADQMAAAAAAEGEELPLPPLPRTRLVRQVSVETPTDVAEAGDAVVGGVDAQRALKRERDALAAARDSAELQRTLMNDIFASETTLEAHLKAVQTRQSELTKEKLSLQREIQLLDAPRDDSLDNQTILWVSLAFVGDAHGLEESESDPSSVNGGSAGKGSNSVHAVVTVLEDAGLMVKRCGDAHEAVERAKELMVNRHLRAVVFGGGEQSPGCGPTCDKDHRRDGRCLVCNEAFGRPFHRGHTCRRSDHNGKRGSWRTGGKVSTNHALSMTAAEFFGALTSPEDEAFLREHGGLTPSRCALYGGNAAVAVDVRRDLWSRGVCVRETPSDLQDWVEAIAPWVDPLLGDDDDDNEDDNEVNFLAKSSAAVTQSNKAGGDNKKKEETNDDDELGAPPDGPLRLTKQLSSGEARLDWCRSRLAAAEQELVDLEQQDETTRKNMGSKATALFAALSASVTAREQQLEVLVAQLRAAVESAGSSSIGAPLLSPRPQKVGAGARSGRDAALAEAWWAGAQEEVAAQLARSPTSSNDNGNGSGGGAKLEARLLRRAKRAMHWAEGELESLKQVSLAAKVVALIPSPEQIKFLNLTYDWLRTFLPHCMAKVNRVSFGLLSTTECADTLAEDPMVPRSRLALAVPFIGKDVPSKSSEFAHPDITIGLTVMAYRYSGLRQNDFSDLVDSLTTEFANEIGPARERASSIRYEQWVLSAGGRLRGLVQADSSTANKGRSKVSSSSSCSPSSKEEEGNEDFEVVQLKFLQKSNQEQMDKLKQLWSLEPLVLHFYLNRFVFPEHMRTQKLKLSASGQSVGGDMLVGRRVGFSGTPSDLLPLEMGKCEYETGDDGKMISTVVDPAVVGHEVLEDGWSVEGLLSKIAGAALSEDGDSTSSSSSQEQASLRFHALIDTGALVTGYSNEEVAKELLHRGLPWCEGVVFLDGLDQQQVLVRATGRVVPADQCGVPLEKRFAFYDQIHTTGMDIKHVVNATAVVTLGKDMVFRDYVQGAYRMRGIGTGQRIHVFVIPEVRELISQNRAAMHQSKSDEDETSEALTVRNNGVPKAVISNAAVATAVAPSLNESESSNVSMLKQIVAWLVVNSMRSEQTQWSMLCLQNVSNIYRKTAFEVMMLASEALADDRTNAMDCGLDNASADPRFQLSPREALAVFEEDIDFSLEAAVPDPVSFESKLRTMLDDHEPFIVGSEGHSVGARVLAEVGLFSLASSGEENKLETEQEREQEQEQQKEVKAKRDQQVEIEKFVDREYSRNEEKPTPWPLNALLQPPGPSGAGEGADKSDHPFYPLKKFTLRHQEPLELPDQT